ncbi:MAG: hypothetical protein JWR50_4351 [Mucilaginibacter sp.]|nr:hypothetical protein [Mucilaginibacter sp.]
MLTELDLTNFKRFSRAKIGLRKINVLVGPNNSGKSSVIAALKILIQTLDSYDDQVPLLLNGPLGEFGTYRDIVYRNHRGRRLSIGLTAELSSRPFATASSRGPDDSTVSAITYDMHFRYNTKQREIILDAVEVSGGSTELLAMKASKDSARLTLERFDGHVIPPAIKAALSRDIRVRHFVPWPLVSRLGNSFSSNAGPAADFSKEHINVDHTRAIQGYARGLFETLTSSDYLGPARTSPQRTYLFNGERRSRIGVAGENMTTLLVKGVKSNREPKTSVLDKVNDWLVRTQMARKVEISPISDRHYEINVENFFTKEKQNIADVGYGHSQVLPILVGGYNMAKGSCFLVEQPELHLHPKAQSELGDFFLDLYNEGVQSIIETHSEHLILRLQQHIAARNISSDDVAFFYIQNSADASTPCTHVTLCHDITRLDLDGKGAFIGEWPGGFFPERLQEARKLALLRQKPAS